MKKELLISIIVMVLCWASVSIPWLFTRWESDTTEKFDFLVKGIGISSLLLGIGGFLFLSLIRDLKQNNNSKWKVILVLYVVALIVFIPMGNLLVVKTDGWLEIYRHPLFILSTFLLFLYLFIPTEKSGG